MNRTIAALLALAAACVLGPATVLAVTTGSYDAASTSEDIRKSCKDISVSSAGTLSGTCNKVTSGAVSGTVSTTHDLTTTVVCYNSGDRETDWKANADANNLTNYTALASGQSKSIDTGSTGNGYWLIADCGGGDVWLTMSRRLRNKTSDGTFEHASQNLWN